MLAFVREPPGSAAGLALALSRWLGERSTDGRAAIARLLAELFTDEERLHGARDDEDKEPTPPLLGEDAAPGR